MGEPKFIVLHVEDDEHVSASIRALLRPLGYEVLSAGSGPEAVAQVAPGRPLPDVLILDIVLPGDMDGIDVAQEVCRLAGHVVPTVLLSGELASAGLPWLPGAPLICFWKPVEPAVLVAVVDAFARLGRVIRSRVRAEVA